MIILDIDFNIELFRLDANGFMVDASSEINALLDEANLESVSPTVYYKSSLGEWWSLLIKSDDYEN